MKAYVVQYQCDRDKYNTGKLWFGTKAGALKDGRGRSKWASVVVSECEIPTSKVAVIAYLNGAGTVDGHPLVPIEGVTRKPLFWNEDGESDKLVPYGTQRDLT